MVGERFLRETPVETLQQRLTITGSPSGDSLQQSLQRRESELQHCLCVFSPLSASESLYMRANDSKRVCLLWTLAVLCGKNSRLPLVRYWQQATALEQCQN